MKKALIFNIQRYSLHDGGGIRTIIFFKGCPLRCPWCSNPESQSFTKQVIRHQALCINCSSASCYTCSRDPLYCPTGALEICGKEYTLKEIIDEIKKDIHFYDATGGGVTLSGGEPMSQGEFALELLMQLKYLGIDTAIETTGMCQWDIFDKVSNYLDRVLFDLKIMDKERAKEILNADIDIIKANFVNLINKGVYVIPRIPLIPGFTLEDKNIRSIIGFIKPLGIKEVHLLPFHQYGSAKYASLGMTYTLENLPVPSDEEIIKVQKTFEEEGFSIIKGGI